jgi:excisionase family DNA binding protein
MTGLSLREAAKEAGTSKSTILRAVKAGRLSATRTDDGGYSIEPAELFRVYPPESRAMRQNRVTEHGAGHDASADAMADLKIRNAIIEAELGFLKDVLASERRRADEIREDRERWHSQAERLALIAPAKPVPENKPKVRKSASGLAWLTQAFAGFQKHLTSAA